MTTKIMQAVSALTSSGCLAFGKVDLAILFMLWAIYWLVQEKEAK